MQYAIDVAPLGELADPRAMTRLAVAAEAAGWDGVSTWDVLGVGIGAEAADPFVALATVAAATQRLRLIVSVVALPRRRPQLVAQAAATLDLASGGRLVLGIGAGGDPADFTAFGEPWEAAGRIDRMDEAAGIVDRLLRGERVEHHGAAFALDGAAVGPRPAQSPRPPIWFGGTRPGGIRRAAAWDGWIGIATSEDGSAMELTPEAFGRQVQVYRQARAALGAPAVGGEVALFAFSEPDQAEVVAAYEAAGATWWLESLSPLRGGFDALMARVTAGPPARP